MARWVRLAPAAVALPALLVCFLAAQAAGLDVPPLTGRVVDLVHLLPPDLVQALAQELAQHEERTGNQVVLLIVPSLEGEPLEEFSHRVATTWELGTKGVDNGVLLLVVPRDRRVRIEVGYGLEGVLTDAASARIIRNLMVPHFKAGDYATGIRAGLRAIMGTIEGTSAPPESRIRPNTEERVTVLQVLLMAVIIGALVGAAIGPVRAASGVISAAVAFVIGLPAGWLLAAVGAFVALLACVFLIGLSSKGPRSLDRGRGDSGAGPVVWPPDVGSSGPNVFVGGGGDFGGGGASGRW